MPSPELYTATEASAISGLGVKAVNNAIDKRIIAPAERRTVAKTKAPRERRYVTREGLVRLSLWQGVGSLPGETWRAVYDEISRNPAAKTVKAGDYLIVDVEAARKKVDERLKVFAEAHRAIHRDPDIMGGEPVFKGTRIPVYAIAAMLEDGASEDELLSGYPRLDRRKLSLARIWATAHPRRGRPKRLSDLGLASKGTSRRTLGSTPGGKAG